MEILTVREATDRLKISESLVRELFRKGRLKGLRIGKKLIRIFADSLVTEDRQPRRKMVMKDYLGGE